jgi:hypothetical protein
LANRISAGFGRPTNNYPIRANEEVLQLALRDFNADAREAGAGCHNLQIFLNEFKVVVAHLMLKRYCSVCNEPIANAEEESEHLEKHLEDRFPHLSYDDLRGYLGNRMQLPLKIYKCCNQGCDEYVSATDDANPTGRIAAHCEHQHGHGHVRFEVIDDLDIIRESVQPNLPFVFKCRLCNSLIEIAHDANMIKPRLKHLRGTHLQQLSRIQ